MNKLRVGILGATGMVGQRFVTLLADHPWFDVVALAASPRSAGRPYGEVVGNRWSMSTPIPPAIATMNIQAVEADLAAIASAVDMVFCALDMDKAAIRKIEEDYAAAGVAVISNNSAHRWTADVPMIMPEVNLDHAAIIDTQRKNRGWTTGLIAVKPNCSIQSYVAILSALAQFEPEAVSVTSLQAISGAGKTFDTWPEMVDNVIPLIGGEEDKSEREPLKIWGHIKGEGIESATSPIIVATCIRVPVLDGHLANVSVRFKDKPTPEQIFKAVREYDNPLTQLNLPSAPDQFITYLDEPDRPQTRLDRDAGHGMGVTMGRLREDKNFDYSFISLAHNTLRGAAGGAVLMAEALVAKGYIRT